MNRSILKKLRPKGTASSAAIFVVLFLLISYFVNFDAQDFFLRVQAFIDPYEKTEKKEHIPESWLSLYGIELAKEEALFEDKDNDGLSLVKEYEYSTNPFNPDTDNDGFLDGEEVHNGFNPHGNGKLDIDDDGLPDYWEKQYGLKSDENDYSDDPDNDGLTNFEEFEHLTDPLNKDTDSDGFSDLDEILNIYDPSEGGTARPKIELLIDSIHVEAPVVLSESEVEEDIMEDLKGGVIRYPDTGVPGKVGNLLLSGHSSNFAWVKGDYNYIFKDLNQLLEGDTFKIKVTQANGKTFEYAYAVSEKDVVKPDDPMIFEETDDHIATLVTCWPLGTNWNRLIVRGVLEK